MVVAAGPESGRDCLICATGRDCLIYLALTVSTVLAAGVEELVEEVVDLVVPRCAQHPAREIFVY